MSENVTKMVLRAELPYLENKTMKEAYDFFVPLLGEPDDTEEWDGEIEYFMYEVSEHEFVPVKMYINGEVYRWGVEKLLYYRRGYGNEVGKENYSLFELNNIAKSLGKKLDIPFEKFKLFSYTWYTGADEPIEF